MLHIRYEKSSLKLIVAGEEGLGDLIFQFLFIVTLKTLACLLTTVSNTMLCTGEIMPRVVCKPNTMQQGLNACKLN